MTTTKDKIIDVAESLFADHGFSETSLRMITAQAGVNLASVNYHFGSKKTLIQAVFDRFMARFTRNLSLEMDRLENGMLATKGSQLQVFDVLSTLIKPIMSLDEFRPGGASVFMNLLGRAYAETQGHIRRFALEHYSQILKRFTWLLHTTSPNILPTEMFWRLHFMLGSFIFTLAGHKALQEISESDFNQKVSIEEIINQLVPFMAAAFSYHANPANPVAFNSSASENFATSDHLADQPLAGER